ncbi:MAG: VOC family protein [Colwellia sp.]|nr:VOC family protein [Colwellia sp.]
MIDHITMSVKDLEHSKRFYQVALKPLGFELSFGEEGVFWAFDLGKGFLFEIASTKSNDSITSFHIAFRAKNKEQVDHFYHAALAAGATNNGEPGPRPDYSENYYACFVLDPDGHNIEAVWDTWPS